MSGETTNKLLEMVDEGLLDARTLALACLKYMSEDEVEDMARANDFLEEEEEADPAEEKARIEADLRKVFDFGDEEDYDDYDDLQSQPEYGQTHFW